MVGNCQPPVWRVCLPKHNVATALMIECVADLAQSLDDLAARQDGELAHTMTSTISSEMEGGTGSPWACKLSK
jgi:hypothetical protein